MTDFNKLKTHILQKLEDELSPELTYHNVQHTIEVMDQCEVAISRLGIDDQDAQLLRTAALLHDIGYIWSHKEHELAGMEFARTELPNYGYEEDAIVIICAIIKATKVPQIAVTILEKIICDADLMYLGTDDFKLRGDDLYLEFLANKTVSNTDDWNKLQIGFLKSHRFHTDYAQLHFGPKKQENLDELVRQVLNE
jgi:uncharacterized protein